ncbi:beta-glucuronidase [Paenibacillus sp. FSL R7-0273]|uniref:glycoside hydrolase family 2 protein n=1 Tax=Paenibacillus sp. FSL R7-0273 TaxID=1536772 RepID=UPI0004F88E1D|nr:glycoside hydrolase family 2 TIM barrel-domain containing protein [Paenibacillus sp. FSL R7-0273]AIQ46125.1 beta-glucuronidase [Paenibacillus sp. FSL R7-0273]OMF92750.1 beta-glucuronidase [Paenibacillus sp. FSL R7-0273]
MIRTFQQHRLRECRLLDGLWDFVFDKKNIGLAEGWHTQFPSDHDQMPVPACWNNELGKYEYEGVAWYRTRVTLEETSHLRLLFHAVLGHADVYWDGRHLGYHYGGYTPFDFTVADAAAGVHELIVRTDSLLERNTIPYHIVDWFHYGGIIRPVEIQLLPDVSIGNLRITYNMTGDTSADIRVKLNLRSLSDTPAEVPVSLFKNGELFYTGNVKLDPGGSTELNIGQAWTGLRRWEPDNPELYMIRAVAGRDDLTDRIGFRTVEKQNKKILLNGKELYLQGVNRHEEHPEWGFAFPNKLMTKDLDIMLQMGCNTVRGSHYPQSEYWIDLLDERGVLFWSEIPIWGAAFPAQDTGDPVFIERALTMMDEMIERDLHHPSILFWSVHNEIDTRSSEAYDLSVKLTELVRSKDQSRLVAYATMHPMTDICLGLFDVIGINYYDGWYFGHAGFAEMLTTFHERCKAYGAEDTPVLMTEFGGAGIHGDSGWEPRLFSEDYQAELLSRALKLFRSDNRISGTYVWQFADTRAQLESFRPHFRDRARSFNNKGLVNEYRKPKLAYRIVKGIYTGCSDPYTWGSTLKS